MTVGIEKINLYAGRFYLNIRELAAARGKDDRFVDNLMCERRSVYPPYEDAVTLAVNAARRLLAGEDLADIELLIVATESAVDFGKPISTWVHRYCELPANCRNFELKHACYGGTAALKMAAAWVAAQARPGKKALVISTDFSRSHLHDPAEFISGGCAVAMLVSNDPQVLAIDLAASGFWTREIADTFRPTARTENGNNELSLYSYLDALQGSYEHFTQNNDGIDFQHGFKKHIYHAPFPAMTFQAHRTMLRPFNLGGKAAIRQHFEAKVAPGLHFARHIGSLYGASNFVCLLGMLQSADDIQAGDRISLFAYGSGCQGEFYSGQIGNKALEQVRATGLDQHLGERHRLSIAEYESLEQERERYIDCPDYEPRTDTTNGAYHAQYDGRRLLTLRKVENYYRTYEWS